MAHRIKITREGVYYLFVLLFVIGGAVFREVNLLLVIASIMIGPIVFSWRTVSGTLARLRVHRSTGRTVAAGAPLPVDIIVTNGRKRLATWALEVQDLIESETPVAESKPQTVRVLIPCVRSHPLRSIPRDLPAGQFLTWMRQAPVLS